MPVKSFVRTPIPSPLFPPETFTEYLEDKSKSSLVHLIEEAREFGLGVIQEEYEVFQDLQEGDA